LGLARTPRLGPVGEGNLGPKRLERNLTLMDFPVQGGDFVLPGGYRIEARQLGKPPTQPADFGAQARDFLDGIYVRVGHITPRA
ncbi:MAG: hypothetical protein ACREDA_06280, partial [Methylocella sp.]